MSEENEIQDGIEDELLMVLKVILTFISSVILAIIGVALGAVVGFYAPYFFAYSWAMVSSKLVGFFFFLPSQSVFWQVVDLAVLFHFYFGQSGSNHTTPHQLLNH